MFVACNSLKYSHIQRTEKLHRHNSLKSILEADKAVVHATRMPCPYIIGRKHLMRYIKWI